MFQASSSAAHGARKTRVGRQEQIQFPGHIPYVITYSSCATGIIHLYETNKMKQIQQRQ